MNPTEHNEMENKALKEHLASCRLIESREYVEQSGLA